MANGDARPSCLDNVSLRKKTTENSTFLLLGVDDQSTIHKGDVHDDRVR